MILMKFFNTIVKSIFSQFITGNNEDFAFTILSKDLNE